MKKIVKSFDINLLHILIPLSLLGILLSLQFRHYNLLLLEIVILFGLFYLLSSMIHHHIDKSLTLEIIIEYILTALLMIILVSGAII